MLSQYFKTTIRSLSKNKGYSFLNIFGLAVGVACAGLIFLWVENELSYDQTYAKKDRLYFVKENQKYDAYVATFGSTPGVLGPAMQAEIPGVANTCRVYDMDNVLFAVNDKPMYTAGYYADASIFSMFTLPFVQGNPKTALNQRYSLVITELASKKYFGNEHNVLGKTIRVDNKQDYVVTGVIKDFPKNSTIKFEWVAPFEIIFDQSPYLHSWGNNSLSTYVELKPNADEAAVNKILYGFIQTKEPDDIARPFLWPMSQWHLYDQFDNGKPTGGGQIQYVRLFTTIAWIILLIACINFMNLATARSEKRAREVGVRKVLGAGRENLVVQFIGEALLLSAVATMLAVLIMGLTLPAFNMLVQQELTLNLLKLSHITALLAITVICGLVAGSYPSFYLSSFNPVYVLKGIKLKTGSAAMIRKGLVILQFTVSIVLILSTIIIYQQIQHVKSRNLGFNKNNLIEASAQGDVSHYYASMKEDLLNSGVVENVALSDHTTLYGGNNTGSLTWLGKPPKAEILISTRYVTPEFIQTSGLKLLEGRDFVTTDSTDGKKLNVIITQSLERLMGQGSAIGKEIWYDGDTSGTKATVVGVVNDYVYGDMYGKPDPVMILCTSPVHTNKMYLRLKEGKPVEQALAKIESIFKKDNAAYPFVYRFVDDQFNQMFLSEMLISKLSRVFALLAILISCLGLFGLAAYTAERRTKEIGVRKVLGASITGIAALLSKDFLKLVGTACFIAFPIGWWAMNNWLQNYKYRVEINWWIFLVAGVAAILIAVMTISFQSVKAATANPVKSLRTE